MEEYAQIPIVCIVGPTAVGKTGLSLELSHRLDGEIISADSMQVYRGMDIGTAKLPFIEREGVPHYMIDVVDPTETFTAYDYARMARPIIRDIASRGKVPFMVGGTGLYFRSVLDDLDFTPATRNEALRSTLELEIVEHGIQVLHERLQQLDPVSAMRIHPNDQKRLIRALEINLLTGKPVAENHRNTNSLSPFVPLVIGLNMEREVLYARIDQRVDQMIDEGLLFEVQTLIKKGCTAQHTSMQAIGYKELVSYIEGHVSFSDAVIRIKQASRRYAKRQLSWFRADPRISWYNWPNDDKISVVSTILESINRDGIKMKPTYE